MQAVPDRRPRLDRVSPAHPGNPHMSSSAPVIRQIAWLSLVPQLAVILTLALRTPSTGDPIFLGTAAYLLLSLGLRLGLAAHHRKGVRLSKQERFVEAIPHFKR